MRLRRRRIRIIMFIIICESPTPPYPRVNVLAEIGGGMQLCCIWEKAGMLNEGYV